MRSIALSSALLLAAPAWGVPPLQEGGAETARPLALLDHQRLSVAMAELVTERPELVAQLPIGTSRAGRRIEALRLAGGEPEPGRPAVLLVAALEGPQAYTSSVALDVARQLAAGYGSDQEVTAFLDTTTVYIVPRANPDACEARFASPVVEVRATGHGVDDDRDARLGPPAGPGAPRPAHGENERSDVNGDGYVSWIRKLDPEGTWIEDPTDPRAMREADPKRGERGKWLLLAEGADDDGDGEVAEDPIHDAEVNRNFAAQWEEHTARAGLFPTDEPEVRALCAFVLENRDIQLVVTFGEQDNLVGDAPAVADDAPATHRVPKAGVLQSDADVLKELGRRYGELGEAGSKGLDSDRSGTFQTWCYEHRGLLSVELCLWDLPAEEQKEEPAPGDPERGEAPAEGEGAGAGEAAGEAEAGAEAEGAGLDAPPAEATAAPPPPAEKPGEDALRLRWVDAHATEDGGAFPAGRHLGWTAFDHPDLGPVEVGGFAPFARSEPPLGSLGAIAARQRRFLVSLGDVLARVRVGSATAKELAGGLVELTVVVENDGLLPLVTKSGERTRTVRHAQIRLRLPGDAVLLAGRKTVLFSDLPGAGGRHEARWLIRGAPVETIGVTVLTDHAGTAQARAEAKR